MAFVLTLDNAEPFEVLQKDYKFLRSRSAVQPNAQGAALVELGIDVDVSVLERLVLAEARPHHVVYKVVAYGEKTERKRLHGHSIVCPQAPLDNDPDTFGEAAIAAVPVS